MDLKAQCCGRSLAVGRKQPTAIINTFSMSELGRFAPSATGRAHPGTLLSGLIAWLDARSVGGQCVLRLEDLDPQRCSPALTDALLADLSWFGLTFDHVERQSEHQHRYAAVLDAAAAKAWAFVRLCLRSKGDCAAMPSGSRWIAYL